MALLLGDNFFSSKYHSSNLICFRDHIVSSGPINCYDSRSRINAMIFWTIQRSTCIRSFVSNPQEQIWVPHRSTRFLFKTTCIFYQKNLNIYEQTCLTIVWQECIRSLTPFRTNQNHEFCLRSWILERGSDLEFQCQVLLTSRTYIWILNETKDAICGFVPRLDFQTKQDLMYGVPPKLVTLVELLHQGMH